MQAEASIDLEVIAGMMVCRAGWADGLRPDPWITVSEWAARYRKLSTQNSANPGDWSNDRAPYQREVMDALSPQSAVREVILMWGAQLGKSEIGNNWVGAIPMISPGPVMIVQPTLEIARDFSKKRIKPLIEECPELSDRFVKHKSRDAGNTILHKEFLGGDLLIRGANSAAGFRMVPVRYVFADECDAYDDDVQGEGDPFGLIKARMSTFGSSSKFLKTSTPSIEGRSRIDKEFHRDDATQEYYFIPCPRCGEEQRLVFRFDASAGHGIRFSRDERGRVTRVWYQCKHCEGEFYEHEKTEFLAKGSWRVTNDDADGTVRSFHLSSLYSPLGWFSWNELVQEFLATKGDAAKLRAFVNNRLAESWREKGEAPEWERLYARREKYKPNTIPSKRCLVLTAGVDVQKDRLEVEITAWGRRMESWVIAYHVFMGDPEKEEVWNELAELLGANWSHPSGVHMQIRRMAVDAGYMSQRVYMWVRSQPLRRVLAVMGDNDKLRTPVSNPSTIDVDWKGKKYPRGVKLWKVGTGLLKEELYGWLRAEPVIAEPGDPEPDLPRGWAHFPELSPEYFRQLCAEELRAKMKKNGARVYEWHKTRDRNEGLDCRIYSRAAAFVEGIDRWDDRKWALIEESLGITDKPTDESGTSPTRQTSRKRKARRRRGFAL